METYCRDWNTARRVSHLAYAAKLLVASAQNVPEPARRNDPERADRCEAQQRGVTRDEYVGVAGERLTKYQCIGRIGQPQRLNARIRYTGSALQVLKVVIPALYGSSAGVPGGDPAAVSGATPGSSTGTTKAK